MPQLPTKTTLIDKMFAYFVTPLPLQKPAKIYFLTFKALLILSLRYYPNFYFVRKQMCETEFFCWYIPYNNHYTLGNGFLINLQQEFSRMYGGKK